MKWLPEGLTYLKEEVVRLGEAVASQAKREGLAVVVLRPDPDEGRRVVEILDNSDVKVVYLKLRPRAVDEAMITYQDERGSDV